MTAPSYAHLQVERRGAVEYVTIKRPEVRNAFNDALIADLTRWCDTITPESPVRAAVLGGAGTVFCAGADLAWMSRMASYTREENIRDAMAGAELFARLDALPIALVARIQGAAIGGGAGLAAVADVAIAEPGAVFGFTEVRLGIIPSLIAPYVLGRIGLSASRELFLTGRRFDAGRAKEIGLVHAIADAAGLDAAVDRTLADILDAAPGAIAASKRLLRDLTGRDAAAVARLTAETIAERRASSEGQEGMRAFLDRRPPSWSPRR